MFRKGNLRPCRSSEELQASSHGAVLASTIWRLPLIYIFMFIARFLLTAAFRPIFKARSPTPLLLSWRADPLLLLARLSSWLLWQLGWGQIPIDLAGGMIYSR